jgi:hypothetical protein
MKHLDPTIPVILALAILFTAMLSCDIDQAEEQTTLFDQYYTIDPTSLIESLRNGDMKAFTPVSEEPELLPVNQQLPVDWLQADYFYIANTLYEDVLGKTLQGWQLNSMDFNLGCAHLHNGFQNGRFVFFKVINEKENESRISRFIDIDPRGNFIHVKEWEYYPKLVDWEIVDMGQLKISADQALQIAESNGGEENRQSVGNACNISLVLSPSPASDKGWVVIYARSDDRTSFFRIQIDPITGEIHLSQ